MGFNPRQLSNFCILDVPRWLVACQKFQSTSLGQIRRPTDWVRHGQPLVAIPVVLVATFLMAMTQPLHFSPRHRVTEIKWSKNLDKVIWPMIGQLPFSGWLAGIKCRCRAQRLKGALIYWRFPIRMAFASQFTVFHGITFANLFGFSPPDCVWGGVKFAAQKFCSRVSCRG